MPCPSCSHMKDRLFFFQGQQPVKNMTAVLALGSIPLCLVVFGNLVFTTARVPGIQLVLSIGISKELLC